MNKKRAFCAEKLKQSIRDAASTMELIEQSKKGFLEELPPEPADYSLHQIGLLLKYLLFLVKCRIICFFRKRKLSYYEKKLKKLDELERSFNNNAINS